MLLCASLGGAKADVPINLLLFNKGDTGEDVAVALRVSAVDIPDPLVNVVERSQWLVPLSKHPIFCRWVQMRMRLDVPQLV